MLKKTVSILGLASIVAGAALWSGGPKALAEAGASQARPAAADDPHRPVCEERVFGPFKTRYGAEEKCHRLERHGWRCRIERHDGWWYIFAWKSRH